MQGFLVNKLLCLGMVLVLSFGFMPKVGADEFQVGAKHVIAVEVGTGRVLYEKEAQKRAAIASLTKLLTAYLVLEKVASGDVQLTDSVTISDYAYGLTSDASLSNVPFEKRDYVLKDLLAACLVASSNSAAIALADHVSGSEAAFVNQMKEQLVKWHIEDFKLVNASGLPNELLGSSVYPGSGPDDENELSAEAVALIAMHLVENFPEVLEITKQAQIDFDGTTVKSFNQLLPGMPHARSSVDGLKTGTTEKAGHCLVASSVENGMRVITVLMNTDHSEQNSAARFEETDKLLNYIKEEYRTYQLVTKNKALSQKELAVIDGKKDHVSLIPQKDFKVVVQKGEKLPKITDMNLSSKSIQAPVTKGQLVSSLLPLKHQDVSVRFLKEGEAIPLKAKEAIAVKPSLVQSWWEYIMEWFKA
ncbi:D-alanyl-D-alanine carboxypeptidase PBP3 [Streptococcus ictaluri]|uniref:serine-type D-Ala-D-Ala carboxypeptidase n=2 Tax=Streptococcus ictaluri TaxID=380397 RepID=G5K3I1_9STRE|nr:serine-type D-Ala-D-Ala carboxypeptidase [Streptococcus ictaluri 707-05]